MSAGDVKYGIVEWTNRHRLPELSVIHTSSIWGEGKRESREKPCQSDPISVLALFFFCTSIIYRLTADKLVYEAYKMKARMKHTNRCSIFHLWCWLVLKLKSRNHFQVLFFFCSNEASCAGPAHVECVQMILTVKNRKQHFSKMVTNGCFCLANWLLVVHLDCRCHALPERRQERGGKGFMISYRKTKPNYSQTGLFVYFNFIIRRNVGDSFSPAYLNWSGCWIGPSRPFFPGCWEWTV